MSTTVREKVDRTRELFQAEIDRLVVELAEAEQEFAAASVRYQAACDRRLDTTLEYNECMHALGRQDSLRRRLREMDERELSRRLENSRKLAERFGS